MNALRLLLKILLPLALLAGGAALAYAILSNSKKPLVQAPKDAGPLVRVVTATHEDVRLDVRARGSVEPLRTVELSAEVSGRIVATHPALRAGGVFGPEDTLVELDATDYQLAIAQYEASIARAELRLIQEQAEAAAALRAWRNLEGEREPDALVRREPQIKDAELAVQAAKAQLARGRLDLERCHVRLPFAGRVRSVHADIGQTVQRGQRLAVVLDTSALEVRLPIPLDEAGFADLPLEQSREDGPGVELSATFGGERATWRGRVVRIEGELDRRTRQLTAIARVPGDGGAPLLVGMFVDAVITGRDVPKVVSVPRAAVTARGELWLVEGRTDDDGRTTQHLRRRAVEILRRERDRVLIESGVAPGEQICVTSMQAPVDGMLVRVDPDQALVERAR